MIHKQLKKKHKNSLNQWIVIISFSVFVPLFFILFKPFGINTAEHENLNLVLLGNGLVTFFVLLINVFGITRVFKSFFLQDSWTFLKQLIWMFWNILSIGLANLFYVQAVMGEFNFSGIQLIWFLAISMATAFIPISILSLINHNKNLKIHLQEAEQMNQKIQQDDQKKEAQSITIYSDNKKQMLETSTNDFIYISSNGNYINVYYLENDQVKQTIIRNTIKSVEDQLNGFIYIRRLHRAYIVNTKHIIHIKGNSQAYKIQLQNIDDLIPVSRSYIDELKSSF